MTKLKRFGLFILLAILFLIPAISQDRYLLHTLIQVFIWGLVTVGVVLNIRTGIFNFGPAAFMAIGAYTTAIFVGKLGISFWLSLPVAAILGIIMAILIGIPILRTKGMYFVLVTALLCQVFVLIIVSLPKYTGAWFGISNIYAPKVLEIDFSEKLPFYYLVLAITAASFFVYYRVWNSHIGKIYKYMGENEPLSQSVGVPVTWYKIQSFAISCCFTSLSGCLLSAFTSYIEPGMFTFFSSINPWLYAVLGGINSLVGALLGTALAVLLQESFRSLIMLTPIVVGIIVIVVIIFLPQGLISVPGKIASIANKISTRKLPGRGR